MDKDGRYRKEMAKIIRDVRKKGLTENYMTGKAPGSSKPQKKGK